MSKEILLSIIIPMYNSANYIEQLLKSYIDNSYNKNDVELIIVDDGSNDGSSMIASSFIKQKAINGRILSTSHSGVSVARNLGIKEAKGKYLLFCDSDDILKKNILYLVKDAIKNNVDIVSMEKSVTPLHDKKIFSGINDNLKFAFTMFGGKKYGISSREFGIGPVRKLYRRSLLSDYNITFPTDIKIWEDGIFNLRALIFANKIELVKIEMYSVRNNPNSTSRTIDASICENAGKVMKISQNELKKVQPAFKNRIIKQENAFILWELFGKFFIWHPNYAQFKKLYSHELLHELKNYGVNLQSRLLIISLQYLGFYPTVFWYKNLKLCKNKLEKKQKWY